MGNIDNNLLQYGNKRHQEGRGLMKSDLVKQLVSERYGRGRVAWARGRGFACWDDGVY